MKEKIKISRTYHYIRSLPVGTRVIGDNLNIGQVSIQLHESNMVYTGNLNKNGVISGLSKLFCEQNLTPETTIYYENNAPDTIKLFIPNNDINDKKVTNYFQDDKITKRLSWSHFEIFRPTNLKHWSPIGEGDIYIAFGVLQEYTDYSYCCAANKDTLTKIGYFNDNQYDNPNKPDAILYDKQTEKYVIAEFKTKSSDYKKNHNPNDVDVLIVWEDDETDQSKLPLKIVVLYKTAKSAFNDVFDLI
jgi:hypothetical protein